MDDQQRQRIRDDLKGFFKGELLFDDLSRALYSTDASIFQVKPLGVAYPRDEEDVQALVDYAGANQVQLLPRGAGTGLAGESLGSGLVLDLSRHFRDIGEITSDTVRVQPGVILNHLNARLAQVGRRFAPDPASGHICTIGGMLATNASGSHSLRHGYTRDHVLALRVVLDSGEAVTVAREPLAWSVERGGWNAEQERGISSTESETWSRQSGARRSALHSSTPRHLQDIIAALGVLLDQQRDLIQTCKPRTPFNRCGYLLHDVLQGNALDMPRLLVGSEGTLALFTEAILRTIPVPGGRSLVLLGFNSLESALRGAMRALPTGPAACELIDRRLLSLAKGSDAGQVASLVPTTAEAVLLVEYEADSPLAARKAASYLGDLLSKSESAFGVIQAYEPADLERLWQLRESALPSLYGLKGGAQPIPFVEDVAVPVEQLPEYLRRVQEILRAQETTASFFIHAGTGQVHTRPFLDLQRPEDVARLSPLAEDIHSLALSLGGTVSTQHGTGLARTSWVARQYGPLYPVLCQVKAIFDPRGIFNPGKIVHPDPRRLVWPLRTVPDSSQSTAPSGRYHLNWHPGEVPRQAVECNGCGHCRTENPQQRMCPIFRVAHTEAASPRAKANLLRYLSRDGMESGQLASDRVREIADLCVHCKMCAQECPAHVNIPKLMLETKAAHVAQHGLDLSRWFLARLDRLSRLGGDLPLLGNVVLGSGLGRWLLKLFFGLSSRRRLPRLARPSFLKIAQRRGWTRKPKTKKPVVAYFVDTFANYYDPQLALAVTAILHHHDFAVYVPPDQHGSGMAALAQGDLETARETALANLRAFAESAREGHTILCSEPTAAVMLRQDQLDLLDDPEARLIAQQTVEFTTFLWDLYRQGRLRTDFQPLPSPFRRMDVPVLLDDERYSRGEGWVIGHHVPCHIKALGPTVAGPALLRLVPDLHVYTLDMGCSGMAGTFGLVEKNYATSLQAGQTMLTQLARREFHFGSSECSSCRMQMQEGAGKPAFHPALLLALSYGLIDHRENAQKLFILR